MTLISHQTEITLKNRYFRFLEKKCLNAIYQIPEPGCGTFRIKTAQKTISKGKSIEYEIYWPFHGHRIKLSKWSSDYLDFPHYEIVQMIQQIQDQFETKIRRRLGKIGLSDCLFGIKLVYPDRIVLTIW